jgi:hypothetical protein
VRETGEVARAVAGLREQRRRFEAGFKVYGLRFRV